MTIYYAKTNTVSQNRALVSPIHSETFLLFWVTIMACFKANLKSIGVKVFYGWKNIWSVMCMRRSFNIPSFLYICLKEIWIFSYVCWTVHHLDSWIKIDQLHFTCFIISPFTAQHVSNVSASIFRSLRIIVDLFHVLYCSGSMCWCYGVVRLGWCGILMQAEALVFLLC